MGWFTRRKPTPLEYLVDAERSGLRDLSPGDLAEYTAGWAPGTKNRLLGEAEMRRRETWSGPVRLSLGLSIVALAISLVALFR